VREPAARSKVIGLKPDPKKTPALVPGFSKFFVAA
jgi:hypothetical protein